VLGEYGGLGLPLKGHTWQDEKNWGYRTFKTREELADAYLQLTERLRPLLDDPGLSAAVYTQTTDVEVEVNGLMTYDRAVVKLPEAEVLKAHQALWQPAPKRRELMPTSREKAQEWRYTIEKPAEDWFKPDFDDGKWMKGPGGFGTKGTPGAVVRTEWKTDDIWIRRTFDLEAVPTKAVRLLMHHDEDVEVYINGVLAATAGGFDTDYHTHWLRPAAVKALRPGRNVIAVHCKQTVGGQYIDVGLIEVGPGE
jgi:hypothetical protein